MLIFLLLCVFSILFEFYLFKLFKYKFLLKKNKTFSGSGIAWFYLNHIRSVYDSENKKRIINLNAITGPKKLLTKFRYRFKFIKQVLILYKYYWLKVHIPYILEVVTFILFLCFFTLLFFKLYSFNLKTIKKFYYFNYYKLLKIIICSMKSNLIKFWKLKFMDKIFFGFLLYTYYYGLFKTYIGLDTFVIFKFLFNVLFIFFSIFCIIFISYIIYSHMITDLPKSIAILFQLICFKSFFYFFVFCGVILLVIIDISSQVFIVNNIFKEHIFKVFVFCFYMLKIKCQQLIK